MIIKINEKKVIEYNEATDRAVVYSVEQIKQEAEDAKLKLESLPKPPTDEELLEWARKNYPAMDTSVEEEFLNKKIELLDTVNKSLDTVEVVIEPIIKK